MNPFFIFETSVYIIQDIYIIYQKNVDVHIKRYFVNIYIYIYLSKKTLQCISQMRLGKVLSIWRSKKKRTLENSMTPGDAFPNTYRPEN